MDFYKEIYTVLINSKLTNKIVENKQNSNVLRELDVNRYQQMLNPIEKIMMNEKGGIVLNQIIGHL